MLTTVQFKALGTLCLPSSFPRRQNIPRILRLGYKRYSTCPLTRIPGPSRHIDSSGVYCRNSVHQHNVFAPCKFVLTMCDKSLDACLVILGYSSGRLEHPTQLQATTIERLISLPPFSTHISSRTLSDLRTLFWLHLGLILAALVDDDFSQVALRTALPNP